MGWFPQRGDVVVDRGGTHFVLTNEIARGGQGIVFATQAEGAAVKISFGQNQADRRAAIEDQIRQVARLPIADLDVALPRYTLADPAVGYTMTLLTGMGSAETLVRRTDAAGLVPWYIESGGLRKRLTVIEHLAEIIASLHARGLVYGDLSGNNVFISAQPDRTRVFLIDLDNLRSAELEPTIIYTAPYGAPEQATTGTSQASDRFSLSVLAFSMLAAANPFYGCQLDALPPEEYQDRPFSSAGPWIDDPDDDSNRWSRAIDRSLVVSPRMRSLFEGCFCGGRHRHELRPNASLLASAARSARLALTRCPTCGWDNFITSRSCENCTEPTRHQGFSLHEAHASDIRMFSWCPFALLDETGSVSIPAGALALPGDTQRAAISIRRVTSGFDIELHHSDLHIDGSSEVRHLTAPANEPLRIHRLRRHPVVLAPLGTMP